jgi:predicted RNase H-related nuclease YkuK (DUF458 family)
MQWFKADGEHIFWQDICNSITEMIRSGAEHQIVIGSDSQPNYNKSMFVVALCVISDFPGMERRYYYAKVKHDKYMPLRERILKEANLSIETACLLRERSDLVNQQANIQIHLDVSSEDSKNKTSKMSSSVINLVKAYNFEDVQIKPNSWAASYIADKHSK